MQTALSVALNFKEENIQYAVYTGPLLDIVFNFKAERKANWISHSAILEYSGLNTNSGGYVYMFRLAHADQELSLLSYATFFQSSCSITIVDTNSLWS